jgi:hypothetical protein
LGKHCGDVGLHKLRFLISSHFVTELRWTHPSFQKHTPAEILLPHNWNIENCIIITKIKKNYYINQTSGLLKSSQVTDVMHLSVHSHGDPADNPSKANLSLFSSQTVLLKI